MEKTKAKKDWPVILATGAVVLLLCGELASLGWRIFAPKEQSTVFPDESGYETGMGLAGTLFGHAPVMAAAARPAIPADLKVYGVVAGDKEATTYALFLIDGQQREVFGLGQEVVPGVTLTKVAADHVVLTSASGEAKLPIIEEGTALNDAGSSSPSPGLLDLSRPRPSSPSGNAPSSRPNIFPRDTSGARPGSPPRNDVRSDSAERSSMQKPGMPPPPQLSQPPHPDFGQEDTRG